jgi:hypothetical protein
MREFRELLDISQLLSKVPMFKIMAMEEILEMEWEGYQHNDEDNEV